MKRLLVIEDDPIFSMILRTALKSRGYEVETENDGLKGLTRATNYRPDLIILDVNLPTMSGFDVAKKLKENDELSDTPILMLTALSQEANIIRGYSLGVEDYLTKPFPIEHLFLKIKKYLKTKDGVPG